MIIKYDKKRCSFSEYDKNEIIKEWFESFVVNWLGSTIYWRVWGLAKAFLKFNDHI